jgi:hypothetical protein
MSRSTAQAGRLQAGDDLVAAPVAALLTDVRTVADVDALAPIIDRRLADAIAAREGHGVPDPLAEDAALDAHAAAAAPLDREIARCRAAVERLTELRSELAEREREAQVEADRQAAEKLQAQGLDLLRDLDAAAAKLAAGLERYRLLCGDMVRLHSGVPLPHFALSEPDRVEHVDVVDRQREAGTYREDGSRTDGQPVRLLETRRVESVHHRGRKCRDPRTAEIVLPALLNDRVWHLRQA